VPGVTYFGFVDPAGGSGDDSMTMAIAHRDSNGVIVLDCVREVRPGFSPKSVVDDFAAVFRSYGIHQVVGDAWGGEFVREPFMPLQYITVEKEAQRNLSRYTGPAQLPARATARSSRADRAAMQS
jgi:hypothetical protein